MILRVIRGSAHNRDLAKIAASFGRARPARSGGDPALLRLHVGHRDVSPDNDGPDAEAEIAVVSSWDSAEAATAADARGASPLSVARQQLQDLQVEHFEIDETVLRDDDPPIKLVRIATGRFSKAGAHTEMLEALRERVPLLGDPVVEAYTGRRLLGREVCVTFVSTWHDVPAGQDLEAALWPDIALRYDSFEVCVYRTITIPVRADPQEDPAR